jgi:hypothetical protein
MARASHDARRFILMSRFMSFVGLPELLFVLPLAIFLVPLVLYILTLRKALGRCAPENRTLWPGLTWLLLAPVFNVLWHFVVVVGVAWSFRLEFRQRSLGGPRRLSEFLGLTMCFMSALAFVPDIAGFAGTFAILCWIAYWTQVAKESRKLAASAPRSLEVTS